MKTRTKDAENRPVYITEASRICGVSGPTFKKLAVEAGIKPAGRSGKRKYAYWKLSDVTALRDRISDHRSPGLPILLE